MKWKTIKNNTHYEVSDTGLVRSIDREVPHNKNSKKLTIKGRIMKNYINNKKPYPRVSLSNLGKAQYFEVHRLVATAFIPNPENKPQVNHIDGNTLNNNVLNLEWVTPSENIKHAISMGKIKRRGFAKQKLNEEKVLDIKTRLKKGETSTSIADSYNVNYNTILNIKSGRTWKHVEEVISGRYGLSVERFLKNNTL